MPTAVCATSDFQQADAREFEIEGTSLILVHWYGAWYAYKNNCPHANWPLNIQADIFFDSDRKFLQCSNHMALFDVKTGECMSGSCVGDRLTAVPLKIQNDQVFVDLSL